MISFMVIVVYQETLEQKIEENCDAWINGTYYESSDFEEAVLRRRCAAEKIRRPPVVVHPPPDYYLHKEETGLDGKIHIYVLRKPRDKRN